LKGGQGESERAREKEMKRRRERGKRTVDSSNRQWQDNFSKDMCLFKVDIPNGTKQHTCTRVFSPSGPDSKCVHYNPCSLLEDRFESLGMVPISSPMAWGGNQVKKYSIISFRGKASSHGQGCSCVVLPPSAMVFLLRLRGEWVFFNPICSFQMRL